MGRQHWIQNKQKQKKKKTIQKTCLGGEIKT